MVWILVVAAVLLACFLIVRPAPQPLQHRRRRSGGHAGRPNRWSVPFVGDGSDRSSGERDGDGGSSSDGGGSSCGGGGCGGGSS